MARMANRVVSRQQMIDMLAILDIDEDEMGTIRQVDIGPTTVRITREVRDEAGGPLLGAHGRFAEYVEERPIDWRKPS
jgi:hypothetical protein